MKSTYKLIYFVLISLCISSCSNNKDQPSSKVSLIPQPQELKVNSGQFVINENTRIYVNTKNKATKSVAEYFTNQVNLVSGYALKVEESETDSSKKNSITFSETSSFDNKESYSLKSYPTKIDLSGSHNGLFYAIQTLFQLLPNQIYSDKKVDAINWAIPSVEIKDSPRFKWRGMHLDVGRFMFPVSFIKKYIDYIAMHKMNTFHWHLTEDQGWRIEIKKYPKLTEVGAWRKGTTVAELNKPGVLDGKRYGGFYTQEDIKELVAYAKERYITIVPEIEMPGHSIAALAAYPELSCTGGPFEVRAAWSFSENIYCAGNDATFSFIEDVLTEVIALFPSEYIHIGGDEAPKMRWKKCSKCQLRIKNEGLEDEHELQSYFISRVEKFVNSKGRKIIGWDEIMQGGLAPNAAIMSWRGEKGGISAAKQKHYSVMSPTSYCYFDLYQGNPENEPRAMEGMVTLEKTYSYNPMPKELSKEEQKYILGVQGNVWTEFIRTPKQVEFMAFPRICALSEVAWSKQEDRDLPKFLNKLDIHFGRLDVLDINYRWPRLEGVKMHNVFIDNISVNLKSKRKNIEVRYTTDGTKPTRKSKLYTKAFDIIESTILTASEFSENGKKGPNYTMNYEKQTPLKPISKTDIEGGLEFEYFEFDQPIDSTLDLLKMNSKDKGIAQNFSFPFPEETLPDKFGLIFNGYVKASKKGIYTFSTNSNDGTRLFIDDKLIVENDGWHGPFEKEGEVALEAGYHKIKLMYFQSGGRKSLAAFIRTPNEPKIEIEKKLLSH